MVSSSLPCLLLLLLSHTLPIIAPLPYQGNRPGWYPYGTYRRARHGMTCAGSFPSGMEYLNDPNNNHAFDTSTHPYHYRNLLELCASPQWGGLAPSAGASCSSLNRNPSEVVFDYRGFPSGSFIYDNRLIMYCHSKCWCDGGYSDGPSQLQRQELTLPTTYAYWRVDLDRSDADISVRQIPADEVEPEDKFLEVLVLTENVSRVPRYDAVILMYTGEKEGRVVCEGPIPATTQLVQVGAVYLDLQQLCAANIYGGSNIASLGGFCSERDPLGENFYISDFVKHASMTPHDSIGLEIYCSANCFCADDPAFRNRHHNKRPIRLPGEVAELEKAFDQIDVTTNLATMRYKLAPGTNILLYKVEGKSLYQQSGVDMEHSTNMDLSLPDHRTQQCRTGVRCQGPADCDGCRCHVTPLKGSVDPLTRQMTFSPGICGSVVSPLIFLAVQAFNQKSPLYKTIFGTSGGIGGGSNLGRRAEGSMESQRENRVELPVACACNTTYVSEKCCESSDGLVWEDPEYQLGYIG